MFQRTKIFCGDNVQILRTFDDACIDLTITSPPYDNLREYDGHSWGWDDFIELAPELLRVTKPGGVVVWIVSDETVDGSETGTSFRQALHFKDALGFRLHDTMIWEKPNPRPTQSNRYEAAFDYCFVLSLGAPKTSNLLREKSKRVGESNIKHRAIRDAVSSDRDGRTYTHKDTKIRHNVWSIAVGNSVGSGHPAAFPEALPRDHILTWTNEGETVLDCFNGGGTTTKAAMEMGRRAIGIEINSEYCAIAARHLSQGVFEFSALTKG